MIQSITFPLSQKPTRLYTAEKLIMGQMRFGTPCSMWPMHAHEGYMFEFVDQGAMWLLEPGAKRSLATRGQYYLLQPGQEHSQEVDPQLRTLYVSLAVERVEEVAHEMGLVWHGFALDPQVEDAPERLLFPLAAMVTELACPARGTDLLFQSLSFQLIVQLVRTQQYGGTEKQRYHQHARLSPEIHHALDFIHAHYTEDLSLEQIANSAALSSFYFLRLFKQQTGFTPYAYVRQLRLKKAAALLSQSEESVSELAARLGFASASHLASAFRHHYGVSPSQYRAR